MPRSIRLLLTGTVFASALTGTAACSLKSTPEPHHVITLPRLPEDDHPERTHRRTVESGEYLANDRPGYDPLGDHVVGVRGDWSAEGGRVLIATDYPGGPSSPDRSVPLRVAEAFGTWAGTDDRTGRVAVYDRSGELMYADGRF